MEQEARNPGVTAPGEVRELRQVITQLVQEMRTLSQRNPNPAAPLDIPDLVDENPGAEIIEGVPIPIPGPVDLDPITTVISARLEEQARQRFAELEPEFKNKRDCEAIGDLSRFARIEFPEKFKVPDFAKYAGTGDPRAHLKHYVNKMGPYVNNIPLLTRTFQSSLEGAALRWYLDSNADKIERWEELAKLFVDHYQYNTEMAPTRDALSRTEKKRDETFRAFARRWRALAAEVRPPLEESELLDHFLKALPNEFYHKLVCSWCQNFPQLVAVGERIESGMHSGRIVEGASRRPMAKKEKEMEIAFVQNPPTVERLPAASSGSSTPYYKGYQNSQPGKMKSFTPLPTASSRLLPILLEKRLVAKEVARDPLPNYFGFDPSKSCIYHMGEKGHDVDNRFVLKLKIQNLLDRKILSFKNSEPNIQQNPLPAHPRNVGMVLEDEDPSSRKLRVNISRLYETPVIAGHYGAKDVTIHEK
ncbi:uncharacterized protein LOC125312698 [Rhodamnia argentea]|uniref:Uncharacterized protein LOC125312698 n=1 Tax=Rhodamnia argentea TaxID=178133 RepID=A0ABM3GTV1_9MYRT|nr:uncharacterized protein LOC125312698 [Rhodamnia argentea]